MSNGKSGRKSKLEKFVLTLVGILIVAILSQLGLIGQTPQNGNAEGELKLIMFDVGQADCFLFEHNGKIAIVDCGETGKEVVKYLKERGITRIDYLYGSHPHEDHIGGMYYVITNVEVGKIIIPEVKPGTSTANWYIKLMKELKNGKYQVQNSKVGDVYSLGDAEIAIIGQLSDAKGKTNNYSTVMKVSFGEMDIIMTGDAETEVEEVILQSKQDISAEILKLGHHGSDSSTSTEFLDKVNPRYALISCGVGNKYEHPKKSTMDKLEQRNVEVYRTDENGTVEMVITASEITFKCEPGDYLSGLEVEERAGK